LPVAARSQTEKNEGLGVFLESGDAAGDFDISSLFAFEGFG